jgi:hypothetical protein
MDAADREETEQGRALFEELLWVHGAIRRDLATVEELASEVLGGLPAEEARERIAGCGPTARSGG